jgi:hypothetical protein
MPNFNSLITFNYDLPKTQSRNTPVPLTYHNAYSYSDAEFSNPYPVRGYSPAESGEVVAAADFTSTHYGNKSDSSRIFYALTPDINNNHPPAGNWNNPKNALGVIFSGRDTLLHQLTDTGISYFGNDIGPITQWSSAPIGGGGGGTAQTNTYTSDIRLKENISLIGNSKSGIPLYKFNYKGSIDRYQGTMAQDLLSMNKKEAVIKDNNGYYMVNYDKIDIELIKL